jgi:hypothetical protein
MEEIIEAIKKFEQESNFKIMPLIKSKTGFDIIEGFHKSFLIYIGEINKLENKYIDFFNGNGYNKIQPEYLRVLANVGRFLEIITEMKKHFQSEMTTQDNSKYSDFLADIFETQNACQNFISINRQNFNLYISYFVRLEDAFGFNDENYITFKEYKDNYSKIEKLDIETFKQWVNAQRIIGKLGNR